MADHEYVKPEILDYGSLVELTEAHGHMGAEDGGAKHPVHHSHPMHP